MINANVHKYINMVKNFSNFNPYLCDVMTFAAVISELALDGKLKITTYKDVVKKEIYELTGNITDKLNLIKVNNSDKLLIEGFDSIFNKFNKTPYQIYSDYYKKYSEKFDKFMNDDETAKLAVINKALDKFEEKKLDRELDKNYLLFDKSSQNKLESDRNKIKDDLVKFGDSISDSINKLINSDDYKVIVNSSEDSNQWLARKLTKIADNIKSKLSSRYNLEVSTDELSIIISPIENKYLRYVISIGYDLSKNVKIKHNGIEV